LAPADWKPRVVQEGGGVTVVFFTYTGLDQERITRYVDTYHPGSYRFQTQANVIATGPGGYIF
jgi:hypothetical protein